MTNIIKAELSQLTFPLVLRSHPIWLLLRGHQTNPTAVGNAWAQEVPQAEGSSFALGARCWAQKRRASSSARAGG